MNWLDFIVLTLAASAIVDVWFNGSIFADWRAFFQSKADDPDDEPITDTPASQDEEEWEGDPLPWLMQLADKWVPRPIAELLTCSFCLSHHTPWLVGLLLMFPAFVILTLTTEESSRWWLVAAWVLKLPAYSLAATRLGNIVNSYLPKKAKYHSE